MKDFKISAIKLAEVMNDEFGTPFLKEGEVRVEFDEDEGLLHIIIGPRDISIDKDGNVVHAGTWFSGTGCVQGGEGEDG